MITLLSKSIRQYKRESILSPAFVTVEVILEVLIPLIMANLIDNGIEVGNMGVILRLGILLVVLAMASLFMGAMSGKYCAIASAGFARNLRHDMYYKVQDFSFSNIDKFSSAGIVTRLTTDVANIQMAYMMIIRVAVRAPAMLIFALIMAFRISSRLALVFLAVLPILGIGLYLIMSHAHPIFKRVFKTYDKMNNVVQENLRLPSSKILCAGRPRGRKFSAVSQSIFKDFTKQKKCSPSTAH